MVEQEDNLRTKMEADKLVTFTKPDIAAFQAAVAPAVNEMIKEMGASPDLVSKIKGI